MHVTDWAAAQKEDPELDVVLYDGWSSRKKADLRTLLGECIMSKEGQMVWRNCQNFISIQGTLYLCSTPKGEDEDLLLFIVSKVHHWTAALNGCHQDVGHQGREPYPFLVTRYVFGGQEWPNKWDKSSRPVDMLPPIWGWHPKGPFMPHSGHCSTGTLACWFYKYRDHNGVGQITLSCQCLGFPRPFH